MWAEPSFPGGSTGREFRGEKHSLSVRYVAEAWVIKVCSNKEHMVLEPAGAQGPEDHQTEFICPKEGRKCGLPLEEVGLETRTFGVLGIRALRHSLASLGSPELPPGSSTAQTARPHWLISTHLDSPVTLLPSNWDPNGP